MGQEASLPQGVENGDESLEEMARAPPSAVDPSQPPPPPPPSTSTGRGGRKLMNAMFRSSQQQQQHGDSDQHTSNEGRGAADVSPDASQQQNSNETDEQNNDQSRQQSSLSQREQQQSTASSNEKTSPRKTIFPAGKGASSRGAALIHSMRNLSLGGALRSGKQHPKVATGAADWEKQWDEDDGESSDEDDVDQESGPLHFQDTCEVDEQQSVSHLVSDDTKMAAQTLEEKQDASVISSDDALEWDTAVRQEMPEGEKPDIQMFLPMLRVLGKGSFGKVTHLTVSSGGA